MVLVIISLISLSRQTEAVTIPISTHVIVPSLLCMKRDIVVTIEREREKVKAIASPLSILGRLRW